MSDDSPHPRRRNTDRSGLPVVVADGAASAPPRGRRTLADFAAQLLGQDGRKRGLRGGPETLDAARETYLKTEYSGPADRRPRAGQVTKREV